MRYKLGINRENYIGQPSVSFTHAQGLNTPREERYTPHWRTYAPDVGGNYMRAHIPVNTLSLRLETVEWFQADNGRTVSKEAWMTLDPRAACALRDFLNEHFPKV